MRAGAVRARGEQGSAAKWAHAAMAIAVRALGDGGAGDAAGPTPTAVLREAQASGLPVVAVGIGGPAELIRDGHSGLLCPPDATALADAVVGLAASRAGRERLARGGLASVGERTWERALSRLAEGYRRALSAASPGAARRDAPELIQARG